MQSSDGTTTVRVIVNPEWWNSVQVDLQNAADQCNDITGAIAAHQRNGKYDAEALLEMIDGNVRALRKLIENAITTI